MLVTSDVVDAPQRPRLTQQPPRAASHGCDASSQTRATRGAKAATPRAAARLPQTASAPIVKIAVAMPPTNIGDRQRAIPCGADRNGTDARCCRVRRHRFAVMAEARDSVHLHLTDLEEGDRIAYSIARKARGAQTRVAERNTQRRIVGPQGRAVGAGHILDLKQSLEPPVALAPQDLGPSARAARTSSADGCPASSAGYQRHRGSRPVSCVP